MAARITAQQARRLVDAGQALLVCAYDDEQKCRDAGVSGALTHREFIARLPGIPKTQNIVFL